MSGLLLEAIVKYHKLTGDSVARESILMAVDDVRARYLATGTHAGVSFVYLGCPAYDDGTHDLDNLVSHAFGYAYRLTALDAYRATGPRALQHGRPARRDRLAQALQPAVPEHRSLSGLRRGRAASRPPDPPTGVRIVR
jgi:hypothetical protein